MTHNRASVPAVAGIGLRHAHLPDFPAAPQPAAWLEVHSENHLAPGGPRLAALERLRGDYPLSYHGVGLSPGSAEGLDKAHLRRLQAFYDRVRLWESPSIRRGLRPRMGPSWPTYCPCLTPVRRWTSSPRTLTLPKRRKGKRTLVENPSAYLRSRDADRDSARGLQSRRPMHAVWAAHQPGGELLETINLEHGEIVLVRRQAGSVRQRVINPGECTLLTAFAMGQTLAAAADSAAAQNSDFDLATTLAMLLSGEVLIVRPRRNAPLSDLSDFDDDALG